MIDILLKLRYILVLASVGVFAGALLVLWDAVLRLWRAFSAFRQGMEIFVIPTVLGAADKFLFSIALMIFAYAITFCFVLDLSAEVRRKLPAWMIVDTVSELKNLLFQLVILYLVVHVAIEVAEAEDTSNWSLLVVPTAVLLLAAAMKLISLSSHLTASHQGNGAPHEPD
ncbi:YqhA family protein [Roseomonas gilardii subsp. gilardii]|uniref:YqhA family protein n=1 Tax=Roseomonas gilardii TaxID=257708 RepID=UPI001FF9461D|nr:YqhA family protein [Roseomonas gilardii]UPG73576.1 YqhA family protein [Roseomonas gilardii subsp. gilardii]